MAQQADSSIKNIDDWFDEFDSIESFYKATGDILAIWRQDEKQLETPKK